MNIDHLLWFHGATDVARETNDQQMQRGSFVNTMNPPGTQSANIVGETNNHQMQPDSFHVDTMSAMGAQSTNIAGEMNNYRMQAGPFNPVKWWISIWPLESFGTLYHVLSLAKKKTA